MAMIQLTYWQLPDAGGVGANIIKNANASANTSSNRLTAVPSQQLNPTLTFATFSPGISAA
ncbi:hypothetical protein ACLBOM_14060 [Escherichia coli]